MCVWTCRHQNAQVKCPADLPFGNADRLSSAYVKDI